MRNKKASHWLVMILALLALGIISYQVIINQRSSGRDDTQAPGVITTMDATIAEPSVGSIDRPRVAPNNSQPEPAETILEPVPSFTETIDTLTPTNEPSTQELLVGTWEHAYEEDEAGMSIYRRADTWDAPPSRYRHAFSVAEDETCLSLALSPNDWHTMIPVGCSIVESEAAVIFSLAGRGSYQIVSIDTETLVLRPE